MPIIDNGNTITPDQIHTTLTAKYANGPHLGCLHKELNNTIVYATNDLVIQKRPLISLSLQAG